MAIFEFEIRGKTYEIEAPDQQSAVAAVRGSTPPGYGGADVDRSEFRSLPERLGRQVGLTARYMMEGPADLAGVATNPITGAINSLTGAGLKTVPEAVSSLASRMGLPQPENAGERVVGSAAKMAATLPATAGTAAATGANALLPLTQRLGAQSAALAGGGAGMGAAAEAAPESVAAQLAGGLAGALAPAAAGKLVAKTTAPTIAQLRAAGKQGYETARASGIEIKPDPIKSLADKVRADLEADGINVKVAPKTFDVLDEVQNIPKDAFLDVNNVETLRRRLGHVADDFTNRTERLAAKTVQKRLDEYVSSIDPSDLRTGTAADAELAAESLRNARGNIAASKRAELVEKKLTKAELRSAAVNSGKNISNTIRQRIVDILTDERKLQGYSPEEIAQMRRIVEGTSVGNAGRRVANMAGAGGGLGQTLLTVLGAGTGGTAAGTEGAMLGAAIPLVLGSAARGVHNLSTGRQAGILRNMITSRSPLARSRGLLPQSNVPLVSGAIVGQRPIGLLESPYFYGSRGDERR